MKTPTLKMTDANADALGKMVGLIVKAAVNEIEARHTAKILDLEARMQMLEGALDLALEAAVAAVNGEGEGDG